MKDLRPFELLPHSHPFLMVDKIISLENGRASGLKQITGEYLSRSDYFPQSLIIEALAQISGLASGQKGQSLFAGIKDMVFHREVKTGDVLYLESVLDKKFGSMFSFSVSASVDGDKVAEGTLFLNING